VEILASGFNFPEAPVLLPDGGVAFSDVLGGGVHRWSPDGTVDVLLDRRRGIGGMAVVAGGGLLVGGRDLALLEGGETTTLLEVDGATGFNDFGTDPRGRVYAGVLRFHPFKGEQPVPSGMWALGGDLPAPREVTRDVDWPNGIGFSPDGGTIYASDYAHAHVLAWDVGEDGGLSERRVFATAPTGSCDGLAVDREGGVLVALGEGGIARFGSDGTLDRMLEVPADFVTSVCFGGEDMRDLYVTGVAGGGVLLRGRAEVPGQPLASAQLPSA
jgi:sugar lactone lactonase YvrE